MKKFEEKKFSIGELKGISAKNIEEHFKLYAGYVKNANLIIDKLEEYKIDAEKNAYAISELQRRFSFEFNGIRNHEFFFQSLEGKATPITKGGILEKGIERDFGSFEKWLIEFKDLAMTRGIGWAILYWDRQTEQLIPAWIDEQHIGQLNSLKYIFGIDMWEHSFVYDYQPSGKKQYVEDFFANLNWSVIEKNFTEAMNWEVAA